MHATAWGRMPYPQAKGGDRILLHDGEHAFIAGKDGKFDRFVTIRPAEGAEARITSSGNTRCGMLKFVDIWFDWRGKDTQTLHFGGAANEVLGFAASREKPLKGSGQHADVFQYWGGPKDRIIIRNNRAYDNHAQQWLAQQESDSPTTRLAFYNNLLDRLNESGWSVMLDRTYQNVFFEFNTIWDSSNTIALRSGMLSSEPSNSNGSEITRPDRVRLAGKRAGKYIGAQRATRMRTLQRPPLLGLHVPDPFCS